MEVSTLSGSWALKAILCWISSPLTVGDFCVLDHAFIAWCWWRWFGSSANKTTSSGWQSPRFRGCPSFETAWRTGAPRQQVRWRKTTVQNLCYFAINLSPESSNDLLTKLYPYVTRSVCYRTVTSSLRSRGKARAPSFQGLATISPWIYRSYTCLPWRRGPSGHVARTGFSTLDTSATRRKHWNRPSLFLYVHINSPGIKRNENEGSWRVTVLAACKLPL